LLALLTCVSLATSVSLTGNSFGAISVLIATVKTHTYRYEASQLVVPSTYYCVILVEVLPVFRRVDGRTGGRADEGKDSSHSLQAKNRLWSISLVRGCSLRNQILPKLLVPLLIIIYKELENLFSAESYL
jgi:hypothetical protein